MASNPPSVASFDRSQVQRQRVRPWRWTTPPTYNPDGTEATPGNKQEMNGVFILIDDALIADLSTTLTTGQKAEFRAWQYNFTNAEAGEWHVPIWAGQSGAVYIRVPNGIWNVPDGVPPAKVKTYFQRLWKD